MSQVNIKMGPEAKVAFNDANVDVTDSDVRVEIKDHDSNDSADATYDHSKPGRRRLVFSIKGHVMTDVPWNNMGSGTSANVRIRPWGDSFPAYQYLAPICRITSFSSTHPAKAGDPSTISFEGHSSGSFTEP